MAARPIAARLRADLERHAQAVAGIEPRAAHLGEIPVRPEIAGAPLGVGLEPAAGEDHRLAAQLPGLALLAHAHTAHAAIVRQQADRARLVAHLDRFPRRRLVQRLDEPGSAARGLDREPAPELELAADLERLAAVDRHEADALAAHPFERRMAAAHQQLDQIGIAAVLRHAGQIVEILVLAVGAEVRGAFLLLGEIRDQLREIIDRVVGDADGARREGGIAAPLRNRRALEHEHAGAGFARGERRAERGIAGADHDHVRFIHGVPLVSRFRSSHTLAAPSDANFGIKGTLATL